ncbi:hypothetical protein AA0119_g458 [Alternaria tenuissima]|uniref:Uncharacterized protein n=2 Tax=Alternaria alternata complex TaxID=187734 RepID=A0A4Q4NSB4_ALTAL|nr:hypothetical protein AA0115_g335 [Alternaria tenuissima]RYN83009.1 hypothetical protein AA0117_g453 [Alternaria alternata]RYO58976.1 hypothetical protein AA0116_g6725 [Alternaria tenuissima]RYR80313.1 hypothetical protein AA0119_g458 [Alternaria tenuissima]
MKPFSISPIVVGTSRLVDPKTSPAFRAIANTIEELWEGGQHHISIPRLQNTLQDLFDNDEASALDIDNDGNTVLNKIIGLFIGSPLAFAFAGDEYVAIIRFLLERGADPNVLRSRKDDEFSSVWNFQGTTCDQLAGPTLYALRMLFPSGIPRFLEILDRILEAGGHNSRPIPEKVPPGACFFREEIEQLLVFENQIDIRDLGDLVPIILRRQIEQFQRLIHKAELSTLNRTSSIDELAPIHFAVLWPTGLRMLLDRGVRVNSGDICGRRPIHFAVALGITDSVSYLLAEDCGLSTPPSLDSLLQLALKLQDPEKSQILRLLVPALIDRHKRLQDMASKLLPPSVYSKLELATGQLREQKAPLILKTLIAHGIDVPQALELDGKSFYNFASAFDDIKMTPKIASAFWDAGFRDIDMPDYNGVTPFLQSWYCANFDMVHWFAKRGVSMSSQHRDAPITALHIYANGLALPEGARAHDINAVPTDHYYIGAVQEQLGIPHDDCRCECSPEGCTPIKFLLKVDYRFSSSIPRYRIKKWIEKVNPPTSLLQQYVYECTRYILFDLLGGEHTCCSLKEDCSVGQTVPRRESFKELFKARWKKRTDEYGEQLEEHRRLCENGIPIPRQGCLQALEDPDIFKATLDSAMSHFDEMDRPDTMSVEQQVFDYINWLLAEGHLDIDVSYDCEHLVVYTFRL